MCDIFQNCFDSLAMQYLEYSISYLVLDIQNNWYSCCDICLLTRWESIDIRLKYFNYSTCEKVYFKKYTKCYIDIHAAIFAHWLARYAARPALLPKTTPTDVLSVIMQGEIIFHLHYICICTFICVSVFYCICIYSYTRAKRFTTINHHIDVMYYITLWSSLSTSSTAL